MELLNELVELASKTTKGAWVADSGEGWDAIISQQDMVNSNFIIGEFIGPDSTVNKDFVLAASPENILAIAEAFRALEQRAEAAEALNNHLELAVRKAEGVSEALRRKAEAAEAKLSALQDGFAEAIRHKDRLADELNELAKQEPIYQLIDDGNWYDAEKYIYDECVRNGDKGRIVFTHPAPAADLAELVPVAIPKNVFNVIYDECGGFVETTANAQHIWEYCRAAILHNAGRLCWQQRRRWNDGDQTGNQ